MKQDFPIRYVNPVFRPPSEAQSLILPVTNGCSWKSLASAKKVHIPADQDIQDRTFAAGHRCQLPSRPLV
jgi:hypothetical protein